MRKRLIVLTALVGVVGLASINKSYTTYSQSVTIHATSARSSVLDITNFLSRNINP